MMASKLARKTLQVPVTQFYREAMVWLWLVEAIIRFNVAFLLMRAS